MEHNNSMEKPNRELTPQELEPFSEDPELVKKNFRRVLEAYRSAPKRDKEAQKKAVGEVLDQIRAEADAARAKT
jgi:hypothetical protein